MRKPGGYAIWSGPVGNIPAEPEMDTFTCSHCNKVVFVRPREDPANVGGLCKICMGLICPKCLDTKCDPFEKKLERQEDRQRFLRSAGIA